MHSAICLEIQGKPVAEPGVQFGSVSAQSITSDDSLAVICYVTYLLYTI